MAIAIQFICDDALVKKAGDKSEVRFWRTEQDNISQVIFLQNLLECHSKHCFSLECYSCCPDSVFEVEDFVSIRSVCLKILHMDWVTTEVGCMAFSVCLMPMFSLNITYCFLTLWYHHHPQLQEPVAFMGGMFAGLLRLDLNEDPLKEWVTRTVEASGITKEELEVEGSKEAEGAPREIVIEWHSRSDYHTV